MELTKNFLRDTLKFTNIKDKYINILVDTYINKYQIAFTAPSYNSDNNYELYEMLGDSIANEAVVCYFYNTFPQLHCSNGVKVIARLKINYISGESYSSISKTLGFEKYIKCSTEEKNNKEKMQKLLEDVFEAFIGVTKLILDEYFGFQGIGNHFIYNFIKYFFDKKEISLKNEDLYDVKTRLKEFFDKSSIKEKLGSLRYEYSEMENEKYVTLYFVKNGIKTRISIGRGINKAAQDKDAANKAIEYLKDKGYDIEKKFKLFCE